MSEVLLTVGGKPVHSSYQEHVWWIGELMIDADGSPRAYGPPGTDALDDLANAGYPRNWWGIATNTQEPDGTPIIQDDKDPCPGYYVSTTAYVLPGFPYSDPRRYLNSEKVVFIVVPRSVVKATVGACKGCKARITDLYASTYVDCVVGDIGPCDQMGEASMAAAKYFNVNSDPKCGGSSDAKRWRYDMWPGSPAEGYVLQAG
jgi:hypothetical protein